MTARRFYLLIRGLGPNSVLMNTIAMRRKKQGDDGHLITDPADIDRAFKEFFPA